MAQLSERLELNSVKTAKSRIYRLRDNINAYEGVTAARVDDNMNPAKPTAPGEMTTDITTVDGPPKIPKRRGRAPKKAAALAAIALAALQAGIDNDVRVGVEKVKAKGTILDEDEVKDGTIAN
jgi:sRNA-binding protein